MDEFVKQRVMIAVIAFNLTVIAYMMAMSLFGPALDNMSVFWTRLAAGVGIGVVAAALAYVAVQLSQR